MVVQTQLTWADPATTMADMPSSANGLRIPTIDISDRNANASQDLFNAAARYGFVFVENYDCGIPPASISHMFGLSQMLFASPLEVKQEVSIASNKAGKNLGWLCPGVEKLDPAMQKRPDVKEYVYSCQNRRR